MHTHTHTKVLARETAERLEATLILANDPDTDRLAVAERASVSTIEWDILTGNEIGSLLGWWMFKKYTERHPNFDGMSKYIQWEPLVCV